MPSTTYTIDNDPFYERDNKVATPAGTFSIRNKGGKVFPSLTEDALDDVAVGKGSGRTPMSDAYLPNSYGSGKA